MPQQIEGRFWVQLISKDALRQYMKFRGYTQQRLANRIGVSKASIGHLTAENGRNSVGPDIARAIEKALDAPPGSLFLAKVTPVTRTTQHKPAA